MSASIVVCKVDAHLIRCFAPWSSVIQRRIMIVSFVVQQRWRSISASTVPCPERSVESRSVILCVFAASRRPYRLDNRSSFVTRLVQWWISSSNYLHANYYIPERSLFFVTIVLTTHVTGQPNPDGDQLLCFPDEISKEESLLTCFKSYKEALLDRARQRREATAQ